MEFKIIDQGFIGDLKLPFKSKQSKPNKEEFWFVNADIFSFKQN
tara:strand:- start:449 stop:580 length:132 start_codon:yes stop_codon:yes gene_type:complete